MSDRTDTTVCPDCKGRGYTESMEGRHLVCTCYYEEQEAMTETTQITLTLDRVARVLFMRYYIHRDDASEEWAVRYWNECAGAPHKGDCPHAELKGPITCDRCVCDEFRADAQAVLDVLS